jgi:hypothetical protein
VTFKVQSELGGVVLGFFDTESQGFYPAQNEPSLMRIHRSAHKRQDFPQPRQHVIFPGDDDPSDDITVTVEEFRQAVENNVGSKAEGVLENRAGKRVVHGREDSPSAERKAKVED